MNRSNNFTFIHIAAAVMVIFGHQFVLMGLTPPTLLGVDVNGGGLRILFLVSGYLVSASYLRSRNALEYLKKRLIRLYPPLIVCLIITVLAMRTVTTSPEDYWTSAIKYVLHNLEMRPKFDLAGVFANNPYPTGVNGSLWTMPIEIACYLMFIPLLEAFKALSSRKKAAGQALVILICVIVSAADCLHAYNANNKAAIFWDTNWFNGLTLFVYFWVGALFQLLDLKKILNIQAAVISAVIYIFLPAGIKYPFLPYVSGYIVLSFALADRPVCRSFTKDVCYGLYLYGFPIQQLLIQLIIVKRGAVVSVYWMFLLSLCVTLVFAVLNYYCLENSGLQKRLLSPRRRSE